MRRQRALCLLLGTLALLGWAPTPAAATAAHAGFGVVWEIDIGRSTVTIGGNVYRVTSATRIESSAGRRITMVELPSARSRNGALRGAARATVEYQAVGPLDELELVSLRLVAS